MKKVLYVLGIIIILISISYSYYESKKTEVFLAGRVVGFDLEYNGAGIHNTKGNNLYTSSKTVGTMTFIKQNGEFAAVGHGITGKKSAGECYSVNFENIQKSGANSVGKIVASIDSSSKIGNISKESSYGVFGTADNISTQRYKKIKTENRYNIKNGTAYILIDFDGTGIKQYEVQITGINYFAHTKNIKISVTSQELINKTGGIVQGMSGSPLVQNGMLIGAINSVDIENPQEGYAIFIDKLI